MGHVLCLDVPDLVGCLRHKAANKLSQIDVRTSRRHRTDIESASLLGSRLDILLLLSEPHSLLRSDRLVPGTGKHDLVSRCWWPSLSSASDRANWRPTGDDTFCCASLPCVSRLMFKCSSIFSPNDSYSLLWTRVVGLFWTGPQCMRQCLHPSRDCM